MPYLQSNAIETVTYDENRRLLWARFRDNGHTGVYEGVPQEIYDALIFSDSIGRFFRDRIEGAYPARTIDDTPANNR